MRQDTARQGENDRAGLGRLLLNGAVLLGRQVRLPKGQLATLAFFLVGALGLGLAVEPGRQEFARPAVPAPAPEPGGEAAGGDGIQRIDAAGRASGKADGDRNDAADGGSAEGVKAVDRPEASRPDVAAAEATTNAALDKLAAEIAKINKRLDEVVSREPTTERNAGSSRPIPSAGVLKGRHEALTVHRAPSVAAPSMASPLRRVGGPTPVTERAAHPAIAARHRTLAGPRTSFGLPPHP